MDFFAAEEEEAAAAAPGAGGEGVKKSSMSSMSGCISFEKAGFLRGDLLGVGGFEAFFSFSFSAAGAAAEAFFLLLSLSFFTAAADDSFLFDSDLSLLPNERNSCFFAGEVCLPFGTSRSSSTPKAAPRVRWGWALEGLENGEEAAAAGLLPAEELDRLGDCMSEEMDAALLLEGLYLSLRCSLILPSRSRSFGS